MRSTPTQAIVEWLSVSFVLICCALAGHHATQGMNPTQWAGAITAVLGSLTVAVSVRVWQPEAGAEEQRARED